MKKNTKQKENCFQRQHPDFSLWQSLTWQRFQELIGRSTWQIKIKEKGKIIASALVIKHQLPFSKCWLEVPRGPLLKNKADWKLIKPQLVSLAQKELAIFIRLNPYNDTLPPLKKAFSENHPANTLILDLSLSEKQLLSQMKAKGRYNIRLAKKKGVIIEESQDIKNYYKLVKETTNRDGFSGHSLDYYTKMLKSLGKETKLYLAKYKDTVIAGGIFTFVGQRAIYYYGASSNQYRNLMAPYLLQWTAIQEAQKRGLKIYDFLGIAPLNNDHHRLAGVTNFKLKFGGERKHYPEGKDLVISRGWYLLYKIYKKTI